jgi:hypothetical protein
MPSPFNFNFGEREMAQGKYTILIEGNGVVQLRSEHDGALALSRHAEPGASSYAAPGDSRGPNVLQFRRYGDWYFLSKIFWLGSAMEISQSKSEREIAKNYRGGPTLATAAAK